VGPLIHGSHEIMGFFIGLELESPRSEEHNTKLITTWTYKHLRSFKIYRID